MWIFLQALSENIDLFRSVQCLQCLCFDFLNLFLFTFGIQSAYGVHSHTEISGDGRKERDIGISFFTFPFGDSLRGHTDGGGKFLLRDIFFPAQSLDCFSDPEF